MKNTNRILLEKTEGKKPLGRSRCRWQCHSKIDVKDKESASMD
jgi:hypothetical protein